MKFAKMHGNGNDYVYVDCFSQSKGEGIPEEAAPGIARLVSPRHTGIGSDGLVLIRPSSIADCRMDMYNADGSRGRMCGNALRCVGKYVHDKGLVPKSVVTVETLGGIKTLELSIKSGICEAARANMGPPDFSPEAIPMACGDGYEKGFIDVPVTAGDATFNVTCVNTGSSHALIIVEDADAVDLPRYGRLMECHPLFPDRVNVSFAEIISGEHIKTRVWERGSGATMACGSGACGALAIAHILGKTGRKATVTQPGGSLFIEWDEATGDMFMTGPATLSFEGDIDVSGLH